MKRYKLTHGWDCGYGLVSDYIEDTLLGIAVVVLDPSEGEYEYGCSPKSADLIIDALNAYSKCPELTSEHWMKHYLQYWYDIHMPDDYHNPWFAWDGHTVKCRGWQLVFD